MQGNETKIVLETSQVLLGLMGLMITIIGFFMVNTLRTVNEAIKDLYSKHQTTITTVHEISNEFNELKGEHNSMQSTCRQALEKLNRMK